jgi:adenosylcobinamide-GDP ribazoletransferase
MIQSFLVALGFLTLLPVRLRSLPSVEVVARSRFWYPVVGLLLGTLLGGWTALLSVSSLSVSLSAFLILLAWVLLTGALHLDGLCDLADGLFGGRSSEERLRILKDPHLGVFGLTAGVLMLLGKFVLVSELLNQRQAEAGWLLGATIAAARCLVLCLAAGAHYPRPEGTGKALVEGTRGWEAGVFALLAAGLLGVGVRLSELLLWLVPLLAALSGVLALRWLCQRRLGGITGDCLGAGIELAEGLMLLAMVLLVLLERASG